MIFYSWKSLANHLSRPHSHFAEEENEASGGHLTRSRSHGEAVGKAVLRPVLDPKPSGCSCPPSEGLHEEVDKIDALIPHLQLRKLSLKVSLGGRGISRSPELLNTIFYR